MSGGASPESGAMSPAEALETLISFAGEQMDAAFARGDHEGYQRFKLVLALARIAAKREITAPTPQVLGSPGHSPAPVTRGGPRRAGCHPSGAAAAKRAPGPPPTF